MAATTKQIFDRAMNLTDKQRIQPVGMLLDSLEVATDEGVEASWLKEIERRVAELDSGIVESAPWAEVRPRVFASRGSESQFPS